MEIQIWVCRSIIACHPERSRNAAESKDLLSHKEILRLRATPSAQDDRFKETEKPQFSILQTKSHTPHTADCAASLAVENAICKLNPPV